MGNYFVVFRKISIFASWYSAFCWICGHTLYGCVDWNRYTPQQLNIVRVTPCMGVWIETIGRKQQMPRRLVTPCMGVWIETALGASRLSAIMSHPVWVCGLKLDSRFLLGHHCSHTLYGCVDWNSIAILLLHRPLSHTLYGCVDWNLTRDLWHSTTKVTPCMGVWIETLHPSKHD